MTLDPLTWESELMAHAQDPDTAENFSAAIAKTSPVLFRYGANYRKKFPPPTPGRKPRVAFYLPTASWLGHTTNLHTALTSMPLAGDPIDWTVIVHGDVSGSFVDRFDGRVVHVPGNDIGTWLATQEYCIKADFDAFVHVSVMLRAALAASMRCARHHIALSYKWHALIDGIDGYIDGTQGNVGDPWVKVFSSLPDFERPDLAPIAAQERAALKFGTVYGNIGRGNKITDEYIAVVRQILDAVPDSCFIYTSREPKNFHHPRVLHLGWVTPSVLWAQVIDVYLDTWPFPSGLTAWEAIAARRPVVFHRNVSAEQGFPHVLLAKHAATHLTADHAEGYIENAVKIAAMPTENRFRWTADPFYFYRTAMRNPRRMATELADAIIATISQHSRSKP